MCLQWWTYLNSRHQKDQTEPSEGTPSTRPNNQELDDKPIQNYDDLYGYMDVTPSSEDDRSHYSHNPSYQKSSMAPGYHSENISGCHYSHNPSYQSSEGLTAH